MANKKVSELTETTNITNSDYIMMTQDGESKKIKANTFSTKTEVTQQIQDAIANNDNYATKDELNELKNSVSNGKTLIADAITDKGVPTSATDTFQTMANNIRDIDGGESGGGTETFYGNIIVNKTTINVNNVDTDSINIKLSQRPTNNQTVTIATNSHIIVSQKTLIFTPTNWNVEQSIIVSHNSDKLTDHTESITLSSPNVSDVTITVNVSNSSLISYGNIVINKTSLTFNKGENETFTIKLDKAPTVNQNVNIISDDDSVTLDKSIITFTPTNYNKEQIVTVSSSMSTTATITLSSEGVSSKSINVIVVEQSSGSEGGIEIVPSEDNFTVDENSSYYLSYTLRGEIGEDEVKELSISCNDSKVNISPSYVTVRKSNFNDSFYISMNIQSTSLASGRTATLTFSGNGFATKTVSFTINNNNTSGSEETYGEILIDTTSVSIVNNSTAKIGVTLDSAPSSNQLVSVSVNNSYAQVDKTGLTFTSSNYSTTQYITVSLGSALTSSEEQTFSSVITLSSNNVSSKTVNVSVTVSGSTTTESYGDIIVNNTILSVNESNSTSFTIKLDKAPTNNQTINIYVNSSEVATVEPTSITFTPYNYNSEQTIIVYGTKDSTSYVDKSTQITVSSNNVSSKYIYLTVKNTDAESGGGSGSIDTDTYLPLEDSNVRNLVPYLSTYYIKPTVVPNEEIILNYFVTDYYGRSYTNNSNFYNYKIIVKRDGKPDIVTKNVSAGDHSVSLGSYSSEGTYHFSIIAVDQYGRYSHELFNYVRVQNSKTKNSYTITSSDLSSYGIIINNDKEEKEYVTVNTNFNKIENDTQKATVQSAIDNAYNNGSVSNGKYKVFIPIFGDSSGTNYKGKTNGWKCLKVKYGSGFDATTFLNQCANNRQNLQRLINDKAKAGYNKIILPNATYMIDNNPIDIPNGVTLDLGGSIIKMCPITGNGALMIRMTDCTDTHLCNGTIEGDYFSHDYANSTSNSEWVSGVEMSGSCRYCSIHDLIIKNITGYGLQNSISSTSPNGNTFYGAIKVADLEQGDIDRETGQNISCAYRLRSGMSNISAYQGNSEFISMSIHLNYQGNEFSSWNYYMYFYDSGNNFIKAISAYQYRQVKIPQNAYYVRIVILGKRLKSNWNLHYQFFRVPTHCEFKNITIDNARCVGMAQGQMKDFLVQDCIITNSGQSSATCSYDAEDGWDGMQDAFFENFRIYDCPNNGFLCCAGHNFCINNMKSDAIYMWERIRWALIKNSTFDKGCVIRGGGEDDIVQHGVTRFYDNIVNAPSYVNYMFENVAKNCVFKNTLNNGIIVNSSVAGSSVSKTVYNNDVNNQIVDNIGTMTDNIDYGQTGGSTINVSGVSLNITSQNLSVGGTVQLVAYITPSNATNQGLTWTTNSSTIASVSSSGLVTANGSGSATITVTTNDGNYQATCSIVVSGSGSGGGTTGYNVVVPSNATADSGNNLYITYSVDNTLPNNCSYELRYNGSYLCIGSLVSTNRVNMYTENLNAGTYNNVTLVVVYDGSVIATSNAFTLTINQSSVITTASLNPVSCAINVGDSQTFTLVNTNATINTCYVTTGKGTISYYSSTSIVVKAVSDGTEYLNVVLSDNTSLSATITISNNTTGEGSTGDGTVNGDNSETDANGYVIVKYPATQQPLPTAWGALGDSITAGTGAGGSSYSYANVCAKDAGINAIYNYGVAGSCMCSGFNTALTDATVEQAFVNRYTQISSSCDLITVLGSVNDHRADVKIGSETSTSNNDFYGALYNLITGLKASYPNARIVFITPFKISGWDGVNMYQHTLKDFRNAIVTQCNRFQIEVVDLFLQEQFSWLKGLYQGWFVSYDYYHPTPAGHQAIADYLRGVLFSTGSSSGDGGTTETYGNIITSTSSLTLNENSNTSLTISLDKAPTNSQTVYITTDGNISASNSSLTFTPSNYNVSQSLTIYSGYAGSGIVTLSSSNVNKVQISVTINSSSSSGGSSESPYLNPAPVSVNVGENAYVNLLGTTSKTISGAYVSNGNATISTYTKTYVLVKGVTSGTDYLNVTLSDGSTLSTTVNINSATITENPALSQTDIVLSTDEILTISLTGVKSTTINNAYASNGNISISTYSSNSVTIKGVNGGTDYLNVVLSNGSTLTANVIITSNGGSSSGGSSSSSGISNSSDTAITQQYSSSHEATPNIANPPAGAYNWKNAPRINPDGSFPNSTWNAFGHWMTTYKVEGASYYDNVGLLLQNPKAWIWNTSTKSWDVLSSDFEWGSWYVEDFWDDGNSTIANSVTWEVGVSGNHSTWVKIKQDSTTSGRCFHPWGYQKNWRSNSAWANNGQPYIVTKIDFKLVKYDENGADNLDSAQLVVNSGGDWWSEVGAVWKPDWSTNRDMCVGKYIKATREFKRAWATNLPSSWSYGLPTGD